MCKFEIWTNPADDNLKVFEDRLKAVSISFNVECVDGDESTCFYDGVVYTFSNESDYLIADEIYMNI